MPEFDIPGLGRARMKLTDLLKIPAKRSSSMKKVKDDLVEALYTEIRAARLVGHSWTTIAGAIKTETKVKVSKEYISRAFALIDKKVEAETGVRALPSHCRGTTRSGRKR